MFSLRLSLSFIFVLLSSNAASSSPFKDSDGITVLETFNQFRETVLPSSGIWMMMFYDESKESTYKLEDNKKQSFEQLGQLVKGLFPLAAIDVGSAIEQAQKAAGSNGGDYSVDDPNDPVSVVQIAMQYNVIAGGPRHEELKGEEVLADLTQGPIYVVIGDSRKTKLNEKLLVSFTTQGDVKSLLDLLLAAMGKTLDQRSQGLDLDLAAQFREDGYFGGGGTEPPEDEEREQRRAKQKEQKKQQEKQERQKKKQNRGSNLLRITGVDFDSQILQNPHVVLVAFTAPWCGHCKRLEPEFERAASKLEGEGAVLAWIDATEENYLSQTYQVQGYPTIKLFPGGAPKEASLAKDYNGERSASSIVSAVLQEIDRTGVPKEIPQLTSQSMLEEECGGHNKICVIAGLPHILESGAAGRNKYKEVLAQVSKSFRSSGAFGFLWFEGGNEQGDFERDLDLTFGFPALVAYSLDRQAYSVLHGAFTERSMTAFLHGVTTGRQTTIKLNKPPADFVTVEEWDGQDAEAIEEEELSLAEIMGWDDEEEDGKDEL